MMQRDLFTGRLPIKHGLGIPYMGCKRQLSERIVDFILAENPNCKYVWDLFGGGGAMSFEFMQRPQIEQVVYNELDAGVVALLRDIQENGITEKYHCWVDRATFHEHKNGNDWFAGFVKTCWSFGNNVKKGYLFSEEDERLKKPLHLAIVERDPKYLAEASEIIGVQIPVDALAVDGLQNRRIALMRDIKRLKVGRLDLGRLQQLEGLGQLQQLERLGQLEISCASYLDVLINTPINETVIYLDPPYFQTEKYQHEICHKQLYDFIKSSPYKIYMSSYESDLTCVAEFAHRSTLSSTNNSKQVTEKLFCNRVQNDRPRTI